MAKIDFHGRVAVVTGAGNGLGRCYARDLARRGAKVVVNDFGCGFFGTEPSHGPADRVTAEITAEGGVAVASYEDVGNRQGGEAIVDCALQNFGKVDIVIANAGNQRNALFEDMTEEMLDAVLDTHLKGAFFVSQAAYRVMKKNAYGRLLFICSSSGIFGNPFQANYCAGKAAILGLVNNIGMEGKAHGITANGLMPNAIVVRPGAPALHERADASFVVEGMKRAKVLAPGLAPEFVSPMAVYLVSERCKSTQACYSVVAGRYARLHIGVGPGWSSGWDMPPDPEAIESHLDEIERIEPLSRPVSCLDEWDGVIEKIQKDGRA